MSGSIARNIHFSAHRRDKDHNIVVGCGEFGARIAELLSENKQSVVVIDKDDRELSKLSPCFGGVSKLGDGLELTFLDEEEIAKAQRVIAVTGEEDLNIAIGLIAKKIYQVPTVIVRLKDGEKASIVEKEDIHILQPSDIMIHLFEQYMKRDV